MASKYWVGGGSSTNWNATSPTNWSDTDGGSNDATVPASLDDIFLKSSANCVINVAINPNSFDMTGYTGILSGSSAINIYGTTGTTVTVKFAGNITWSGNLTFPLRGTCIANFTSGGYTFKGSLISMNCDGLGTVSQQDALNLSQPNGTELNPNKGTWNTNGYAITGYRIDGDVSTTRVFNITNSTITLNNHWTFTTTTGLTLTTTGSTILSTGGGNFSGGGKTYNTVTFSGNGSTISGNNTFTTLNVNTAGLATGLIFTINSIQTVTNFTTNGYASNLAKILSSSAGSHFHLTTASAQISVDYMSIKDSYVDQANTWYAGANSTDVSGNTNWLFTKPVLAQTVSETVTGTDVMSIGLIWLRTFSDNFTITDTVAKSARHLLDDTITVSSVLIPNTIKQLIDTITLSTDISKANIRILLDTTNITEIIAKALSRNIPTDSITCSDSITKLIAYILSDNIVISSLSPTNFNKLLSSIINVVEIIGKSTATTKLDTITLSPEGLDKAWNREYSETIDVSSAQNNGFSRSLSSSITVSDLKQLATYRVIFDLLDIVDILHKDTFISKEEILQIIDDTTNYYEMICSETLDISSEKTIAFFKECLNTITVSDNERIIAFAKLLLSTINVNDIKQVIISRIISDTQGITEGLYKDYSMGVEDVLTIVDTVSKQYQLQVPTERITAMDVLREWLKNSPHTFPWTKVSDPSAVWSLVSTSTNIWNPVAT